MDTEYVEDAVIILPNIKDSVHGLGDLWDCNRSKGCGFNLFAKHLKSDHLITRPIKSWEYSLTHLQSTRDVLKNVKLEGLFKLELLNGLITVEATAGYSRTDTKSLNEERLICKYNVEMYSVELLPAAKEVMDQHVTEQLMKGKIHATHVVRGVVLGGEVNAELSIKQTSSDYTDHVHGSIVGKMAFGPINAELKAQLDFLDSTKASNFEKRITIHSKPPMRNQPSTVKEMFEMVESIDKYISNEQHFRVVNSEIQGVPIRFVLVPINQFLDVQIERLYVKMKDDVMENFTDMLTALHDFRLVGYIKSKVIAKNNRLCVILDDLESPLTVEVMAYEKLLKQTSDKFFKRSFTALDAFKRAKCTVDELLDIVNDYANSNFSVVDVDAKVEYFVSQGVTELSGIHDKDAIDMNAGIIRFTNMTSLKQWLNTESKIKIFLNTLGTPPDGVFTRLFKISNTLKDLDIQIGLALPSISDGFSMIIKVEGDTVTHEPNDIPFVLGCICAIVGINSDSECYFHALNASLSEIILPLDKPNLIEMNTVIETLKLPKTIIFSRSPPHTIQLLTSLSNKNWKFYVCLGAIDTAMEAVEKLKIVMAEFDDLDSDWIAGSLGLNNMYSAPLLFVFRKAKLEALCFDNFDMLILIRQFSLATDKLNPDLTLLSPQTSITKSFYPDKARLAVEVIKLIQKIRKHKLDSVSLDVPTFDNKPDPRLVDLLELTRGAVKQDNGDIISTVTSNVIAAFSDLENLMKGHGWSVATKRFGVNNKVEKWRSLCSELENWLMLRNPLLAKVESARLAIKVYQASNESDSTQAENEIKNILDDSSCLEGLRTDINKWTSSDIKYRYNGIAEILGQFTMNPEFKETYLHILAMITLLKRITESDSMTNLMDVYEILPQYIDRITTCDTDTIGKIMDYQLNRRSYHLVTLLAKFAYDSRLSDIHTKLDMLYDLNDMDDIANFLNLFTGNKLNEENWLELWKNPKFIYLINCGVNDKEVQRSIVSTCVSMSSTTEIPKYVPGIIAECWYEIIAEHKITLPKTPSPDLTLLYKANYMEQIKYLKTLLVVAKNMAERNFYEALIATRMERLALANRISSNR